MNIIVIKSMEVTSLNFVSQVTGHTWHCGKIIVTDLRSYKNVFVGLECLYAFFIDICDQC